MADHDMRALRAEIGDLKVRLARAEGRAALMEFALQQTQGALVSLLDTHHRILWCNQAVLDHCGRALENVVGQRCHEVLRGEPCVCEDCLAPQVLAEMKPVEEETVLPDGRVWRVRIAPVLDAEGQVDTLVHTVQDTTQQRETNRALLESRARSRADKERLLDAMQGIVVILMDADARILWANGALRQSMGLDPVDLAGHSVAEVFPCPRGEACAARRSAAEAVFMEEEHTNPDGRTWMLRSSPILDEAGTVAQVVLTASDITRRRTAEAALKDSEARYKALFDGASDAIFVVSLDASGVPGAIVGVNQAALEAYGYKRREILGLHVREVDTLFDGPALAEVKEELAVKQHALFETEHRAKDGRVFPVEVNAHALEYGGDRYFICAVRDISERRRVEAALRESGERLRLVLEATSDGVWDHNLATGEEFHGENWLAMLGYGPGEVPATQAGWLDLIHPEDREPALAAGEAHLRGETERIYQEFRMRCKDGSYKWILSRGKVVERGLDGQALRLVGTHTDITARKEAEENLRLHKTIVSTIGDMVAYITPDYVYREVNEALARFLDVPREQVLGKKLGDFLGNDVWERRIKPDADRCFAGESVQGAIYANAPDGTRLWVSISRFPVFDDSGRVTGQIAVGRDITELMEAKERAEAANTAKGEFLANVSHEIRTPLNGVLGMLQLMQLTPLDEEQAGYVETALSSGRGLLTIINDILDFSKVEAGRLDIVEEPFDPRDLVASVTRVFVEDTARRGVDFTVEVDPHIPAALHGDPARIRQVLFNLVGNAVKFTEEGAVTVRVGLRPEAAPGKVRLVIEVADTGPGIPQELQAHIFDKFTQVDASLRRRYGGTGLGLGIVKRLAERMGGEVALESAPGKGSVFTVSLVLGLAETGQEEGLQATTGAAAPTVSLEVLVAEDNLVNRVLAERLLEKLGHQATGAANGKEALGLLKDRDFDLLLVDIQMPDMDGVELVGRVRRGETRQPDIPAIALTAHAMKGDREAFLEAGMDGYLPKPMELAQLREALAEHASGRARTPA